MDVAVGTALLNMYAKYESLQEARKIFNSMPHQDPIAWNAIIAAYAQNGHNKAALQLFYQMRKKSWNPSQATITSIVGVCSTAEDLAEGKLVHAYIIGNGYLVDSTVGSALVNMYGYCGVLEEAIRVFQKLDHHSTPLYSSLIIAYSLQRQDKDSIKLFHEMRQQCGELNKAACFHVLNECSLLVEGKLIHAYIIANKDESHVIIEMALIGMYGRCGSLDNSFRVFSYLENCNVIVWNELMAASVQNKKGENALQTFQQLLAESVEPNVVTFVHVLNACSSTMDFREGILVHSFIITSRVAPDVLVWNCIINMYCNSGSIEDVRRTFKQSPQHNVASWNILMASCIQHESDEEAIQLFRQMQESGIEPNRSTFVTVLNACSNLAALTEGVMVHLQINSSRFCSEVAVGNALIQMYGKCGSLHDAYIVFTEMPFRDVASWNTIIGSYGQHGYGDKVLQFFVEMVKTGIEPSAITFVSVLSALNHSGMVDHGHHYFVSMSLDYGLVPIAEHYCCLVDLLARAWRLDEAEDFISKMPFQPGAEAWRALLRSYRKLVVK